MERSWGGDDFPLAIEEKDKEGLVELERVESWEDGLNEENLGRLLDEARNLKLEFGVENESGIDKFGMEVVSYELTENKEQCYKKEVEDMDWGWDNEEVNNFVEKIKKEYGDWLTEKIGCRKNYVCKIYVKGGNSFPYI